MNIQEIFNKHKLWLDNKPGGERANLNGVDLKGTDLSMANLREANLSMADLRRADLRRADLRGVDLDFSCWPLWCGSFGAKVDDRIVAQLICHLTRVDDSECSDGMKEAMEHIRAMAITDLFCEYRHDVKPLSPGQTFG